MRLQNNENGVSEIIGAMLILLILVIFLGTVQVYEVPKWNKELEMQEFDKVYSDFADLRSNLEDVSFKNIPKTSSMHMGVRYPERFMFRNPGPGASGTITTYPLNISLVYSSNGSNNYMNYTSVGMVYELKGISDFPKLVYENGIIIKDFGYYNYSDDINHLTTNNNIFIPLAMGIEPLSSMQDETLNILPIQQSFTQFFSSLNVTIETRYPQIWAKLSYDSKPSGSNISVDNGTIKLTDIYGFNLKGLYLPRTAQLSRNEMYAGIITFDNSMVSAGMGGSSSCASPGQYISEKNQGCIDLPPSANSSQFIIKDIAMVSGSSNAVLRFTVKDTQNNEWDIATTFGSDTNGNPITAIVDQKKPVGFTCSASLDVPNRLIDLTSCYQNVSIIAPNVLTVIKKDDDILHVNFLIN